jgi:AraC family transcriptional regulator
MTIPTLLPLSTCVAGNRIELLPSRGYDVRYRPDAGLIGFVFESQSGTHAFASDRPTPFRTAANSLSFVPADCDVMSKSARGGEYLTIQGPLAQGFERRFNDHVDQTAIAAAHALRRLMLGTDAPDPLAIEAAAMVLRNAVSRAQAQDSMPAAGGHWMTKRRLTMVDDLIEARMDQDLSVAELAETLGLSSGFFTRAFRAATGMSPHRYILERRLSRARRLLADGSETVAQVAAACGFASHAHLCVCARRHLGVTPGELRTRTPHQT